MKYLLLPFAALLPLLAHGQPKTPALPDGPGKEQVATLCSGCHGLGRVMSSGYPQAYWHTVVRMMINFGVAIPPDQILAVTDYLAANLPERGKPDAAFVPGPAKVVIREWQVPIPGSRPHDPLATRDGAIWYTGQMTNRLGRVDPKTGQVKEYPLKSPATGPHGLVEDRDGNIFFTGNHQALVGKLDPKTGKVTEYRMPDPNAKDPHSLAFAPDGTLFFTLQQSKHDRQARSEERPDHARHVADGALAPLRHHGEFEGRAARGAVRHQQDRARRPEDPGDQGIHAARSRRAPAAHGLRRQ